MSSSKQTFMEPILPVEHKVGSLPASYRDLAKDFIDFATKKTGSIHGKSTKYPVYYLGTYWDSPPGSSKVAVKVDKDVTHLFVNPIIAVVSVQEHAKEFGSTPTKKQVMGRTEGIIDDADAEITIRGANRTADYSIGQLQRIQIPYRQSQPLNIGKGVWPNYPGGGQVDAWWDGYFIALGELQEGTYQMELKADSPFLGNPGHRYYSSFDYEVTI
jgi:hypothetical protein